ncbi:Pseudouridine-5'-phosphatase, partial [Quaeritorhiza haematococci]
MMGLKERDAAALLIKTLQIPMTPEEYLKERNVGHEKLFPSCRPLPGVMQLVSHLKKHAIPIAVATSSHKSAFKLKSSENQPLFSLFDGHIICGDDPRIKKGKPAPDLFLEAARQLVEFQRREEAGLNGSTNGSISVSDSEIDPKKFLVFEDAPSGVKAALNAGMNVVWIPDPNMKVDPELAAKATEVLGSMADF